MLTLKDKLGQDLFMFMQGDKKVQGTVDFFNVAEALEVFEKTEFEVLNKYQNLNFVEFNDYSLNLGVLKEKKKKIVGSLFAKTKKNCV